MLFSTNKPHRFITMITIRHLAFLAFAFTSIHSALAMEIVFPADPKAILDVKRDFGAKGDGIADDTDAIQSAIEGCSGPEGSRFLYLPKGIYKVTRPIIFKPPGKENNWGSMVGPWIFGQERDATIIRLVDGAAGFGDPAQPQELIRDHWRADRAKMNADFFDRTLVNFTVDCGKNAGAVGLKFYSNNTGVMRMIRVIGNGVCGVDLGWTEQNGPLLIQDVEISGFATGISTGHMLNSQTLSRVTIRNASKVGLRIKGQTVAAERIAVIGSPLAMEVVDGAMVSLVDCSFTAGTKVPGPAVVVKKSTLYAQRLTTAGYQTAIAADGAGKGAAGPVVPEYSSEEVIRLGDQSPAMGLGLTIKPEPPIPWETDPKKWVCANEFGATPGDDGDDSEGIQKAIDHAAKIGASTVYLRGGQQRDPNWYQFKKSVKVHGSVRHITGLGFIRLLGAGHKDPDFPNNTAAFLVEGKDGPPVVAFSHLQIFAPSPAFVIANRSPRTVVCDTTGASVIAGEGSSVFMTNCVGHLYQEKGSQVWIRQWDPEGEVKGGPKANTVNSGGSLWILGMKTEGKGTKLRTQAGGRSEVLSVHNYPSSGISDDTPYFEVQDATLSCSAYREVSFVGGWWRVPVLATFGGKEFRQPKADWCNWALLRSGP